MPTRPEVLMYDSTDVSALPGQAAAVAGYVDGRWPTWPGVLARFPSARHLSITVTGNRPADFVDTEPGNVGAAGAVQWLLRQRRAGHPAPGIYASLSEWPLLLELLRGHGLKRSQFRIWTAHWTGAPHRCGILCDPRFDTEADATQFVSGPMGRNYDVSVALTTTFTSHTPATGPAGR